MKSLLSMVNWVCFFASFTLNAGAALLNVETTESSTGIFFSLPDRLHPAFLVSQEVYEKYNQDLLNDPYTLRISCHEAYVKILGLLIRDTERRSQINEIYARTSMILEKLVAPYLSGYRETLNLMLENNRRNPLFALGECHSDLCPLNRLEQKASCPREGFIERLLGNIAMSEEPKTAILFASGRGFFEMELLLRLIAAGHKIGKIILIDPYMDQMIQYLSRGHSNNRGLSLEYMREKLPSKSSLLVFQVAEMLYFLHGLQNNVQAFVYANHRDYLKDMSTTNIKADLIVAMDYLDYKGKTAVQDLLLPELDDLFREALKDGGLMATAKVSLTESSAVPEIEIKMQRAPLETLQKVPAMASPQAVPAAQQNLSDLGPSSGVLPFFANL